MIGGAAIFILIEILAKIISLKTNWTLLPLHDVYPEIMSDLYWTICYYNLKEKWLRGGISFSDWKKIEDLSQLINS